MSFPLHPRCAWRLAVALAATLGLVLALAPITPADAAGGPRTETTLSVSDPEPEYGDTIVVTATVASGEAPATPVPAGAGTVLLRATLMPAAGGPPSGPPEVVDVGEEPVGEGGLAEFDLRVDEDGVPGLEPGQAFSLEAEFVPTDATGPQGSASAPVWISPVITADPIETTVTVTGPETATVGTSVALTARVTPDWAAGSVQFFIDDEPAGLPAELEEGVATRSWTFTAAGPARVTAAFVPGDPDQYDASEDVAGRTVQVDPASVATTTVVTGPSTATAGTPVALTASVTPADAVGTVQFYVDDQPAGPPVAVADGVATRTHTFTAAGSHHVRAGFVPSDLTAYAPSESDVRDVAVSAAPEPPQPAATSIQVATVVPVRVDRPTTLIASVSPNVRGTVQFLVDGVPVGPARTTSSFTSIVHVFTTPGPAEVSAVFTPSTPDHSPSTAPPVTVEVTRTPTAVEVLAPAAAAPGRPIELGARVAPSDVPGTVEFLVDGGLVASRPVSGGYAAVTHAFATAGTHTVQARFVPDDTVTYDGHGSPTAQVAVAPVAPALALASSKEPTAGRAGKLTASVTPADATGIVVFAVDGRRYERRVVAGSASTEHEFLAPGPTEVVARFVPDAGTAYAEVVARTVVTVAAGSSAVDTGVPVAEESLVMEFDTCDEGGEASWASKAVKQKRKRATLKRPRRDRTSDGNVEVELETTACDDPVGLSARSARAVRTTVPCVPIDDEYVCDLGDLDEVRVVLTATFGLPAALAGRKVELSGRVTEEDPDTGVETVLVSATETVRVPRRTALAASLAPARAGTATVGRGAVVPFRLRVQNAGIVTADRVRACVTVSAGASVRSAPGLRVRKRTACWTLPTLTKGRVTTRSLKVVAPRRGDLRLTAVVTPRADQADPVRLRAVLPVG